jgi:hypothetical protein
MSGEGGDNLQIGRTGGGRCPAARKPERGIELIEMIKLYIRIWEIVRKLDIAGLWFVLELLDGMGQQETDERRCDCGGEKER